MHYVPLVRRGRMHPWGDSGVIYTHDSSSVRRSSSNDTNEPRCSPGAGLAGTMSWVTAAWAVAVDSSSGTLGYC